MQHRYCDIDRAKGMAIFLVVLGHVVATDVPIGNEWYAMLKQWIYLYHMPFFMFISGLVFGFSYKRVSSLSEYSDYIFKKIKRLFPGFLMFGLLIYIGKLLSSRAIHVDDVPGGFSQEIFYLFVIPSKSAGGSLWYIYVLLEMYFIFPLLLALFRGRVVPILFLAILVYFLKVTNLFMLHRVTELMVFFGVGLFIAGVYEKYVAVLDRFFWVFIAVFLVATVVAFLFDYRVLKGLAGLSSIPAVHALVRTDMFSRSRMLLMLGGYSYAIYLMNTIVIGLVKGVVLSFTSWDGINFLPIFFILLVAGTGLPIFLKAYIIKRIPFLDRVTS